MVMKTSSSMSSLSKLSIRRSNTTPTTPNSMNSRGIWQNCDADDLEGQQSKFDSLYDKQSKDSDGWRYTFIVLAVLACIFIVVGLVSGFAVNPKSNELGSTEPTVSIVLDQQSPPPPPVPGHFFAPRVDRKGEMLNPRSQVEVRQQQRPVYMPDYDPRVQRDNPKARKTVLEKATEIEAQVRLMKAAGVVFETDSTSKVLTKELQEAYRKLLRAKYYGVKGEFIVKMNLRFPAAMLDEDEDRMETIEIELAPLELMPYSVGLFLEMLESFQGGEFHRNAGHVLQARVFGETKDLAFQEYSADYPHKPYTIGYAGRPGGTGAFYINTIDNVQNHGPGSQGSATEADSCFARVLPNSIRVVDMMASKQPKGDDNGFVEGDENIVIIESLVLVNTQGTL